MSSLSEHEVSPCAVCSKSRWPVCAVQISNRSTDIIKLWPTAYNIEIKTWRPYEERLLLSKSIYVHDDIWRYGSKTMALPVLTKTFLLWSPDTAMLFAPFRCTHPPPPVLPFLLTQNVSPKDIAGRAIVKLKIKYHDDICRYGLLT